MTLFKLIKDQLLRIFWGKDSVPRGLFELQYYFRMYGKITFQVEKTEDGRFIAVSQNFRYGSIVTEASNEQELESKIKDALLTAFEIPSSYAKEAQTKVERVGKHSELYAAA